MLLENQGVYHLKFEVNGEVSLRTFMGDHHFRELILDAVRVIGDTDKDACVLLLDKITERRRVLELLIQI